MDHYARAAALSDEMTYRISAAHVARRIGDWSTAEQLEPRVLQSLRARERPRDRTQPFPLLAAPDSTPADQLAAARQMAQANAKAQPVPHKPAALLSAQPRLRIGYVSSDFHDHATTYLMVEVLELHDRERFEIVAFDYSVNRASDYRTRVLKAFDRVVPVAGMPDAEAARRIAAEDIAIAVDLKGWTQGARPQILAHRPAPVAVQWLGYPGTMGAPWIDYALLDPIVVRLPHSYFPNDRRRAIGTPPTRAAAGLPEGDFVFCCFNQPYKINRSIFALWMDLLRAVPRSVLWLIDSNAWATTAFKQSTEAAGISADRLIFARSRSLPDHLARLSSADLALDCAPCGSHTTATDALLAGVPQIAFCGNTVAARVSCALVTAVGLPDLIVKSEDAYRKLAIRLATDSAALAEVRARLSANRLTTPLFDSRLFVRHLEAAYEAIWQRCAAGLPPDHINIPVAG